MTNAIAKLTTYKIAFAVIATAIVAMFSPLAASAQVGSYTTGTNDFGLGSDDAAHGIGLGSTRLDSAVVTLINVLLGFLGLIAVIIILIGGFRWMTAGGNEDKVGEARKTIYAGIIGLAIILFAWSIARFAIEFLAGASKAPGASEITTL